MALLSFYTAGDELHRGDLVVIDPADGKIKKASRAPWEDPSAFYLPAFERVGDIVKISDRSEIDGRN